MNEDAVQKFENAKDDIYNQLNLDISEQVEDITLKVKLMSEMQKNRFLEIENALSKCDIRIEHLPAANQSLYNEYSDNNRVGANTEQHL